MQAFTAAICNNLRFDACLISWLLAALLEPLSVVHMEQHGDSVSQTSQTILSARDLLMSIASCQRIHCVDLCLILRLTRAKAQMERLATRFTRHILGSHLAYARCIVPIDSALSSA
ncbi:TPA: hypothetical protein ACH3X3_004724 [Trebouxia sp. C0006]